MKRFIYTVCINCGKKHTILGARKYGSFMEFIASLCFKVEPKVYTADFDCKCGFRTTINCYKEQAEEAEDGK